MSALVKTYGVYGAGPTLASVDFTTDALTFEFGRDDALISAAANSVPVPTAAGTRFSARKTLQLYVASGGGATSLSNRTIYLNAALPPGANIYFMPIIGAYTQNTLSQGTNAGDYPADQGTNGAIPANPADGSYDIVTLTPKLYDATTVAAVNTTANGLMVVCVLALDYLFAIAGGGTYTPAGQLLLGYDEA